MIGILFLLFLLTPLIEIYVLLQVGESLGALPTFALVLLTAFAGTWFVKQQGFATLQRIRSDAGQGRMPTQALIDGAFVLAAGLLLLTPGFVTDAIGFSFLFPPTRALVAAALKRTLAGRLQAQVSFGVGPFAAPQPGPGGAAPPDSGMGEAPRPRQTVEPAPARGASPAGGPGEIVVEARSVRRADTGESAPEPGAAGGPGA